MEKQEKFYDNVVFYAVAVPVTVLEAVIRGVGAAFSSFFSEIAQIPSSYRSIIKKNVAHMRHVQKQRVDGLSKAEREKQEKLEAWGVNDS